MLRSNTDCSKTIFALASGALPSAIAVVKISGPKAFEVARTLFNSSKQPKNHFMDPNGVFQETANDLRREREMRLGDLKTLSGELIDSVLMLKFPLPHSHTGEDVVEFHCHGTEPIWRKIHDELIGFGLHPASPGEFSYRAYLNGKLSLPDVETLSDVFVAKEFVDLRAIYLRRDGSIERSILVLREHFLRLLAILDTAVDFSEEYSSVVDHAKEPIHVIIRECSVITQRYSVFRQRGQHCARIVLAGCPNAGKSSVFNALLCRYRSIVNERPGTTRDIIEEDIELGDQLLKLVDTAGMRLEATNIENQGITMGREALSLSKLWILVVDGTVGLKAFDEKLLSEYGNQDHIIIWNKLDMEEWEEAPPNGIGNGVVVNVSAKTGDGISNLWELLGSRFKKNISGGNVPLVSVSQNIILHSVLVKLNQILGDLDNRLPPEIISERCRQTLNGLEGVVGTVDTEEVLSKIFSQFCIGK